MDTHELYEQYVKPLSRADQLRLAEMIIHDLKTRETPPRKKNRSVLELEGLGAEIWQGVNVKAYIEELRNDWDN